jgi:sec-independent protein translocase protein TatA
VFSQVGPGEIILVLAIALIVLGPKRLPSAARSVGRGLREFKHSLTEADPRAIEEDDSEEPEAKRAPAKPTAAE